MDAHRRAGVDEAAGSRKVRRPQPSRVGRLGISLAALLALALAPRAARAEDDFFGSDFETFTGIPAAAAESLADGELEDLRGGFLGFYFSVGFSGFAEVDGSTSARLDVQAGLGDQSRSFAFDVDDAPPADPPRGDDRSDHGSSDDASRGHGDGDGIGHGNMIVDARPSLEGNALGPAVTVRDSTTGEAFRVQAMIGEAFAGAQGVFQITQVPGNLNNVGQNLVINLVVLQAPEGEVGHLQQQLGSLFGF